MTKHLPPAPIENEVRKLLKARRGEWQKIAQEIEISHAWLSKFYRHQIENPGCRTMHLVRQKLLVDAVEKAARAAKEASSV